MLSTLGQSRAGGGPRFHSVGLVGLSCMEALSCAARLNCSAADARLQLIDLDMLLGGELVPERPGHGVSTSALALVAVESERILPIDLAVHDFA